MPLRESAQQAWDNALQVIPSKYVIPPSQSVFPAGLLGSIDPPMLEKTYPGFNCQYNFGKR